MWARWVEKGEALKLLPLGGLRGERIASHTAYLKGNPIYLLSLRTEYEMRWPQGGWAQPFNKLKNAVQYLSGVIAGLFVDKMAWKQSADYHGQVDKICFGHMGGGTSMSYKLFAVFQKGLGALRTCLR